MSTSKSKSLMWFVFDYSTYMMLPILAIMCIVGYSYISHEKARLLNMASMWSVDASAGIGAEIGNDVSTVNLLASSPDIRSGDLSSFYNRTKALSVSGDAWISVRDRSGTVLMSTETDHYGPNGIMYHDSKIDHAIFDLGQNMTSDLLEDNNRWYILVATPVFDKDDHVIYSLQYEIPAKRFMKLLDDTTVPLGWFLTLTDNNDVIVARTINHTSFVGHPSNPQFVDIVHNLRLGDTVSWDDKTSLEGNRIVGAVHKMRLTGWTVGVSAESSVYGEPIWNTLFTMGTMITIMFSVSILISWLFTEKLSGAVSALSQRGRDLRDEKETQRLLTNIKEIDDVISVMDEAESIHLARRVALKSTQKELHHRVKNSIQTAASLLRLQRSTTSDPSTQDALDKAAIRLNCIGRVHQGLYSVDDLVINSGYLYNVLSDIKEKLSINLTAHIEDVVLDLDLGTPLALIVEEAVTNAYRYGRDGTTGAMVPVNVSFTVENDVTWRLVIRDFGPGFSVQPVAKGKTLGIKLMTSLEKQLNGTVTFTNHPEGGGIVTITGPLHINKVTDSIAA